MELVNGFIDCLSAMSHSDSTRLFHQWKMLKRNRVLKSTHAKPSTTPGTQNKQDISQAGNCTIQLDLFNDSRYYMATKMIANAMISSAACCMAESARLAPLCSSM